MTAGRKSLSQEDKLNEIKKYEESYLASISDTKKSKWSNLTTEEKYKRILFYKRKLKEERTIIPLLEDIKSSLKGYVETLALQSYKSELLDIIKVIDKKIEDNKSTDKKLEEIQRKKKELEEQEKALKLKQK
jgi:hypothetical protein